MSLNRKTPCTKGHNTRAALKANDLSQIELAEMLGIHSTNVSQWCVRGVSKNYANKVADLLSVPVGTIVNKKHSRRLKTALPAPGQQRPQPPRSVKQQKPADTLRQIDIKLITELMNCSVTDRQAAVLEQLMKQFINQNQPYRRYQQ